MNTAYLRWYYGYQNFGDELLLFWIIEYLITTYKLEKLIVEVGNKKWIEKWVHINLESRIQNLELRDKVEFVEIKQHRYRRLTHVMNLIGLGKYKHMFKFFGGGEVLSDERPFPHDGRNIPLLFNWTVRRWEFILIGWIGTPKKRRSRLLYKDLLHRAKELVIRDPISLRVVQSAEYKVPSTKTKLYEDFSLEVLRSCQSRIQNLEFRIQHYMLVNINTATCTSDNIHKIQLFCQERPDHKIIYFPCDMDDDYHCFDTVKSAIPEIEMYDWTKYSLQQTIQLFLHTEAGIGSRLHFLLPLKFFNKPFQSIAKAEKVHKMIDA